MKILWFITQKYHDSHTHMLTPNPIAQRNLLHQYIEY